MFGLSYARLIGFGLAALAVLFLVAERSRWMRRAHSAEAQVAADCQAIRLASNRPKLDCKQAPQQIQFLGDALKDVKVKTEAAKAEDAAHAREVESRQTIASKESSHDYQTDIAAVRARAERLRSRAPGANQGSGGGPPVSSSASGAGRPNGSTAQAGLSSEDQLTATEQAIQLKAIQDWARKVGLAPAR